METSKTTSEQVQLRRLMLGIALCTLFSLRSAATTQQLILEEKVNKQWQNELLSYEVHFANNTCKQESIRLTGPKGQLAHQLSDIVYWPDSSWIKSAKIWFITDLPPLDRQIYTVSCNTSRTPIAVRGDSFQHSQNKEQVEYATPGIGIRMLVGHKRFAEPVLAKNVPGPVAAMRLANGTWYGGSRLFGDLRVVSYNAEIVSVGPVFGESRVVYEYDDGRRLQISVRLAAGQSRIEWSSHVTPDGRAHAAKADSSAEETVMTNGWELLLSPGLPGLTLTVEADMSGPNPWSDYGATTNNVFVDVPLATIAKGRLTALAPFRDWWNSQTQTFWVLKPSSKNDEATDEGLDEQAGDNFEFELDEPTQLYVMATKRGLWVEPGEPAKGLQPVPAVRQKHVYLTHSKDGLISAQFPIGVGQRHWITDTVIPEDVQRAITGKHRGGVVSPVPQQPLDTVKDWILDWPTDAKTLFPNLFLGSEDLEAVRKRMPTNKAALLKRLYGDTPVDRWNNPAGIGSPGYDADALAMFLMSGSREILVETQLVERLRRGLQILVDAGKPLGNWGGGMSSRSLPALFDALIGSEFISDAQRKLFRAQMAYVNYLNYVPEATMWSLERGYASGNANMTVTNEWEKGMTACAIHDHPLAKTWMQPMVNTLDAYLDDLGPEGEWGEALANHAHVATAPLVSFAVASSNAGSAHDFMTDPRFKKLMLYFAKQYTPVDPRHGGARKGGVSGTPPIGRAWPAQAFGTMGAMAWAARKSDPAFSEAMQWSWLQTGRSHSIHTSFGGYESVVLDETLPARVPDWRLDYFPVMGAIMRHGLGTENEYQLNFLVNPKGSITNFNENGGLAVFFAKGAPISSYLCSYRGKSEALATSRVLPMRGSGSFGDRQRNFGYSGERKITAYTGLARQDYVLGEFNYDGIIPWTSGGNRFSDLGACQYHDMPPWPTQPNGETSEPPLAWARQILFVKDHDAAACNYVLFRDTVLTDKPSMWQFWTISDKVGTAQEAEDVASFLQERPGNKVVPHRELKGDRFTAVGPFGVDLEYYVASPQHTPRHTLRWGVGPYAISHLQGYTEFMDLMHLQLAGKGVYFVALLPRRRHEETPKFETLGDGRIIKVSGQFGTDYSFMSLSKSNCTIPDLLEVSGTVASIQDRPSGLVLSLGAEGQVTYKGNRLSSDQAVSLIYTANDRIALELPSTVGKAKIELTTIDDWQLQPHPAVAFERKDKTHHLTIREHPGKMLTLRRD